MSNVSKSVSSVPPDGQNSVTPRNVRWALLGVMFAMVLSMLDNLIVGTAMPTIVSDLGGLEHISWVVTAYTLATAASTPVWGKLGDLYSRKQVYLASVVIFLVGSALSGAAQSMTALIVFRAVQGLGAGGIGAGAFALIAALVSPRERGRYQGMIASVMAIGTVGGPLVGGFVTDHFGWRWAFYVNLPVGLLALVWCQVMLHVPAVREAGAKVRIDWAGIALMTAGISALTLAVTWAGTTYAWASWQIVALFAAAVALLAAFVALQRRTAEPLLPLRIFTGHRNFPLASVLVLVAGVATFGSSLYLPLFQQTVQGASASNSGLLLLPLMIPIVVVSQIGGKVISATGRYKAFPVIGVALMTTGFFLLSTMDIHTSRTAISIYMALVGAGLGCLMQMGMTIAQNSVEMRDIGAASAAVALFRMVGGSLGVAVFGSLFTQAVQPHLPTGASGPDLAALSHLPSTARDAYLHGVATGTHQIFLTAAVLCAVSFLAALAIKQVPLRAKPEPASETPQPQKPDDQRRGRSLNSARSSTAP